MTYFADTHTHSRCSFDGSASMTAMARAAKAAGLDEICFTDHCDFLSPEGTITPFYDWEPVRREISATENPGLLIKRGIEIGGVPGFETTADEILSEPLDFVIGSVHNLSVEKGCTDLYELDYKNNVDLCRRCMEDYLESMEKTVLWNGFDTLGHLPYPLRYFRDRDGADFPLEPWEDRIRPILKSLIQNGKALELNSCRGKSVEDYVSLFRWYKEEGGELITLGSDAHRPEDIAKGIREGQALLRSLGFRYFCCYTERKPDFHLL